MEGNWDDGVVSLGVMGEDSNRMGVERCFRSWDGWIQSKQGLGDFGSSHTAKNTLCTVPERTRDFYTAD